MVHCVYRVCALILSCCVWACELVGPRFRGCAVAECGCVGAWCVTWCGGAVTWRGVANGRCWINWKSPRATSRWWHTRSRRTADGPLSVMPRPVRAGSRSLAPRSTIAPPPATLATFLPFPLFYPLFPCLFLFPALTLCFSGTHTPARAASAHTHSHAHAITRWNGSAQRGGGR